MRNLPLLVLLLSAIIARPPGALAQAGHVEKLQEAAVACISGVITGVDSVRVDADENFAYVRPALLMLWRENGVKAFLFDSTESVSRTPSFRYRVNDARISLERAASGRVARTASISLQYLLTGPDERILTDELCTRSLTDTLTVDQVNRLVDPRFAETSVSYESRSLLRRVVEPAVILGAAVIGTYLFFNLRSKRTEGG